MMDRTTRKLVDELVLSHAQQRDLLAKQVLIKDLSATVTDLQVQLAQARGEIDRANRFIAKHYAATDTEVGAAARMVYGDEVGDKLTRNTKVLT